MVKQEMLLMDTSSNPRNDIEGRWPNDKIITAMESQIQFLRSEILNKDEIIKLLCVENKQISNAAVTNSKGINSKVANSSVNRDTNYDWKKVLNSKLTNRKKGTSADVLSGKISISNRFNALQDNTDIDSDTMCGNEVSNIVGDEGCSETCRSAIGKSNKSFGVATESFSNKKGKRIILLGDSMISAIKPHLMKKAIPSCSKFWVRSFSGSLVEDMHAYSAPSLKLKGDVIACHVGTNDLRSSKSPETIADDIINLATTLKSNCIDVVISGIIGRNDDLVLNKKAIDVNFFLENKCFNEKNITFSSNSNILPIYNTNRGGLHLNSMGVNKLANNLIKIIDP